MSQDDARQEIPIVYIPAFAKSGKEPRRTSCVDHIVGRLLLSLDVCQLQIKDTRKSEILTRVITQADEGDRFVIRVTLVEGPPVRVPGDHPVTLFEGLRGSIGAFWSYGSVNHLWSQGGWGGTKAPTKIVGVGTSIRDESKAVEAAPQIIQHSEELPVCRETHALSWYE